MPAPLYLMMFSLLLASSPLQAETSESLPLTPEQAKAQHQEGAAIRKAAEQAYVTEKDRCYQRIQVNACLEEARKRYMDDIVKARKIDVQASEFEREFRRDEAAVEDVRRAEERTLREARQQERAERFRAKEAARAAAREKKLQEKESKAEKRRARSKQ
jgi:hypothetical protein